MNRQFNIGAELLGFELEPDETAFEGFNTELCNNTLIVATA